MYSENNKGFVIPSYTMTGTAGGPRSSSRAGRPILDRDKYIAGDREHNRSVFTCPVTFNVAPFETAAQTGTDPGNPRATWIGRAFAAA
jgi:hypothetical protein